MKCPKCGTDNPDEAWNCISCRINLYWVTQHYDGLAGIRERHGLPETVRSPSFLVKAHKDAMDDRAVRGGNIENKVRSLARKVMRRSLERKDPAA